MPKKPDFSYIIPCNPTLGVTRLIRKRTIQSIYFRWWPKIEETVKQMKGNQVILLSGTLVIWTSRGIQASSLYKWSQHTPSREHSFIPSLSNFLSLFPSLSLSRRHVCILSPHPQKINKFLIFLFFTRRLWFYCFTAVIFYF